MRRLKPGRIWRRDFQRSLPVPRVKTLVMSASGAKSGHVLLTHPSPRRRHERKLAKRKGRPKAASHSQAATPFLDDVSCSHLRCSEYVFADYSMDTPIAVDH